MNIRLNCDMGEGFGIWKMGLDEAILPYIDMANLACGFHASDPLNMIKTVDMAKEHNVQIGAHVAYHDLVGFGRRSIVCSEDEIEAKVLYQLGALEGVCKVHNTKVSYVKPHGALYNDMMRDEKIFLAIAKAIAKYDSKIHLMILSTLENQKYQNLANELGLELIYEIFADRNYTDEGFLVSRTEPNSVITNKDEVIKRIQTLLDDGYIEAVDGSKLQIQSDTICVHGDNDQAVEFVKEIRKILG